ncbi:LytTR family transcriptional regulator DNA-binding domain-containing protein [Oscillibacter sp.]
MYLHTKSGTIEYYGKLEAVEQPLDYQFVRCHRSHSTS